MKRTCPRAGSGSIAGLVLGLGVVLSGSAARAVDPVSSLATDAPSVRGDAGGPAWHSPLSLQQLQAAEQVKASTTNQDDFDVLSYYISLRPDFDTASIAGTVVIHLQSLTDGLDHIDLDLYQTMSVTGVSTDTVGSLFTHANDILTVQLPTTAKAGATFDVTVAYEGTPQPAGFMGMQFTEHDGVPLLATLSEPTFARSWWPCKDVPTDKAEVELICEVPASMYCASNGELVGVYDGSPTTKLYYWRETYPIATYLVSVAVTEYAGWEESYVSPAGREMTLEYRVFPEHYDAARVDFERTSEMLDLFATYFGEYPFISDKYGMAEFVWEGAMEHQTMTSYGDFLLTGDKFFERIVAHELSHQWWGNLMTLSDWDETWLHEGFATYCEALWIEHVDGPAAYASRMQSISFGGVGFSGPIIPPENNFGHTVYKKGAWVLHMLRHVLGDETFFAALYDYARLRSSQYANVTTEQLIDSMEDSTDRELSWFFDQWLYREGRPTYAFTWHAQPWGNRHRLTVEIDQIQTEDVYVMPIDLRVWTASGYQDFVIWVDVRSDAHEILLDEGPTRVMLDPNNWVLARVIDGTATSSPRLGSSAVTLLPAAPNPFNPTTLLRFRLPRQQPVRLRVFDAQGRQVRVLDPGTLPPGTHSVRFDGLDRYGLPLASGVYRVLLEAGVARHTQSVILAK